MKTLQHQLTGSYLLGKHTFADEKKKRKKKKQTLILYAVLLFFHITLGYYTHVMHDEVHCVSMVTYLAIIVQVRVKPDGVIACRHQIDERRGVRVILRKIHVKLETSVGVRGITWSGN